jgi:hypothetical protein
LGAWRGPYHCLFEHGVIMYLWTGLMVSCCGLKDVLWVGLIRVSAIFYAAFEKIILYFEVCLGGT